MLEEWKEKRCDLVKEIVWESPRVFQYSANRVDRLGYSELTVRRKLVKAVAPAVVYWHGTRLSLRGTTMRFEAPTFSSGHQPVPSDFMSGAGAGTRSGHPKPTGRMNWLDSG
jgi:hypothetical protein